MKRKIKRHDKFCVYIVECNDGTYYTGYTKDLVRRVEEHNGKSRCAKYTRGRGPVKLVWSKEYRCLKLAMQAEYRIKQLRREQKEKLVYNGINGRNT